MLARGALGNPWLFARLVERARRTSRRARRSSTSSTGSWTARSSTSGPDRAGRYLRKFYPWYVERLGEGKALQAGAPEHAHRSRRRAKFSRFSPSSGYADAPFAPPAPGSAMPKDIILTPEGLEKLKAELEDLTTTKRREVAERIKDAREYGDISENSEYDDAKNEQAMLEARIATIEEKLRSATVVKAEDLTNDVVQVGSLGQRQGPGVRQVRPVHDRRLDRGQPGREEALERVARSAARCIGHKKNDDRHRAAARTARRASSRSRRSRSRAERPALSDDLLAARRAKLDQLRADGVDPFPHAFPGVTPIADVHARYDGARGGEETEERVRLAGRLVARRGQGKMAFLDLEDRSGRIQLQSKVDVLGDREARAAARRSTSAT